MLSVLQDVLELLEKRVKSRFSHRQIPLLSRLTLPQYLQRFQTQLRLHPEDVPDQHFTQEWNAELEVREGGKMKVSVAFSHHHLLLLLHRNHHHHLLLL